MAVTGQEDDIQSIVISYKSRISANKAIAHDTLETRFANGNPVFSIIYISSSTSSIYFQHVGVL